MKPAASVADPATVVMKEFSMYTSSSPLLFFSSLPKLLFGAKYSLNGLSEENVFAIVNITSIIM